MTMRLEKKNLVWLYGLAAWALLVFFSVWNLKKIFALDCYFLSVWPFCDIASGGTIARAIILGAVFLLLALFGYFSIKKLEQGKPLGPWWYLAILGFAGVGALVSFILAGVFFLFSAGNPERVKKARETMLYAALGLMILLGSYAITNFILSAIVGEFKFDQPVTPAQTQ